eukprot:m.129185 g.129185  ORF g.129185 m.129185 type:complete len:65 (+) comp9459_c1_seq4:9554-9748(+)
MQIISTIRSCDSTWSTIHLPGHVANMQPFRPQTFSSLCVPLVSLLWHGSKQPQPFLLTRAPLLS